MSILLKNRESGEKGHAKGLTKCGDFYVSGYGVDQANKNVAIKYYLMAQKLGETEAMLNLGALFE